MRQGILIDLSNNNGPEAAAAIGQPGVQAVYAKATEGLGFKDADYPVFRVAAKKAKRLFGGYLFLHPDESGEEQAAAFLAYAAPKPGDLQPVVDSETGPADQATAKTTFEALYGLEKAGYRPILYGSAYYLAGLYRAVPALRGYRAWEADYGLHRVRLFIPSVVLWQFTDRDILCKGRLRVDGSEILVRDLSSLVIPKKRVRPQPKPVRRWPRFGRI